ncbi:MAG: redoxin domain-containing protein [Fuerstiella sp.]
MRTYFTMGLLGTCGVILGLLLSPRLPTTTLSIDLTHSRSNTGAAPKTANFSVYVVLSTQCPISNSYLPKLNKLHQQLRTHAVDLIGVIPSAAASQVSLDQFQHKFEIEFPIVLDHQHKLCNSLKATHTPQAVIINSAGTIVYSGRIDDRYSRVAGQQRAVRHDSLQLAIDSCLSGNNPEIATTDTIGCCIEAATSSSLMQGKGVTAMTPQTVVFTRDIAPILFSHCTRCHRAGESAPFELLTYNDAVLHAKQIREVVQQKLMPPWKPAVNFGSFKNEHRLSDSEIAMISNWVEAEMPEGPASYLPTTPEFPTGWQLGQPDLELIMPEPFEVPADGPDIYRHFVIPTGIAENCLVSGFEFRPGTPEVVHHATTFYDTTGKGRELDEADPGPGYSRVGSPGFVVSGSLGGWGPGGLPNQLPMGMGRPLLKNADLIVQIHYHPIGRKVKDQSRIGLYFAAPWSERLVTELIVANVNLEIPANESRHLHQANWTLPVDTILLDATPHMHVLGKKIRAIAAKPDGEQVPLIQIDDWDFYWQDSYAFSHPIELPAGTKISVDCVFDNSSNNPQNPYSPPQDVYWGDFSNDEMGICYFQATTKNFADYETLNMAAKNNFQMEWDAYEKQKSGRESLKD